MQIPGLIVKKVGMSRMVDAEGRMVPVTLVQAENQRVTKVMTTEKDGYDAVQVGFDARHERKLSKPDLTRLRKVGVQEGFVQFKEIRLNTPIKDVDVGFQLSIQLLDGVSAVDVTGKNKGRGFQGAIKRHGSARGRMTHGSCYHRRTGSIGSNTSPGRVFKNKKMPGHMGTETITVQNLSVMEINKDSGVIALKGSIPGFNNSYLVLKPSIKA